MATLTAHNVVVTYANGNGEVHDLTPHLISPPDLMAPDKLVAAFMARLKPLGECPEYLGYSHQYGRRMVLDLAVVDVDIFDIHGRWYVTVEFLDRLAARGKDE